jgi:glucose-1-phosphate adenylyltransferase
LINKNSLYKVKNVTTRKDQGTTLEKTVVAEGALVFASRVETSVLGIRTRIGHGTTVVSCYLMGND